MTHQVTYGDSMGNAIGFNWNISVNKNRSRKIYHSGGTFGFTSYLVTYPDQKIGIILLSNENDPNSENGLAEIADGIFKAIATN